MSESMVWFTADTHFGHARILEHGRGKYFSSVDQMDAELVANWNAVVGWDDWVFHLGDYSFLPGAKTRSLTYQLKGHKALIRGNHDKGVSSKGFEFVKDYHELSIQGQKLVLSHYPLMTWNKAHKGSWQLHGHSHGNLRAPNTTRLDVGVDVHGFTPVSFESIRKLLSSRSFVPTDHHE